jgi:hypothetical protein
MAKGQLIDDAVAFLKSERLKRVNAIRVIRVVYQISLSEAVAAMDRAGWVDDV